MVKLGGSISDEHRKNLSLAKIGKKQSPEHVRKRVESMRRNDRYPKLRPFIYRYETPEETKIRMEKLTFVRRLKSSHSKLPRSYSRAREYNQMHDLIYGKNCYLCGETRFRLHLHHLWYEDRPFGSKGSDNIIRKIEAIQHPERFVRLCHVCHSAITLVQKNGQRIIDGLSILYSAGNNKQGLQERIVDFYAK